MEIRISCKSMMFMKYLILSIICFCSLDANAFEVGIHESIVTDSLSFTELYRVNDRECYDDIKIHTEEKSIQKHDGIEVYCEKRNVEYSVLNDNKKIVIKRKVLSNEPIILSDDRTLLSVYPNVTSTLLCALLKHGKIKKDANSEKRIDYSLTHSKDGCVLTINKIDAQTTKSEKIMGETVTFNEMKEAIKYSSCGDFYMDAIYEIESSVSISTVKKNSTTHNVDLLEKIVILSIDGNEARIPIFGNSTGAIN